MSVSTNNDLSTRPSTIPSSSSTDRQSLLTQNGNPTKLASPASHRDERRPLNMDRKLPIDLDNKTIHHIINSILTPPKNTENNQSQQSQCQQYLLPVDLLVSVDKSNKPTVQAAIPSAFAFQPPPLTPLTPLTLSYPFTPTLTPTPSMPITQTLPSIPSVPMSNTNLPSIPMSLLMSQPQTSQQPQSQQFNAMQPTHTPSQSTSISSLNPSAATFKPSASYTQFIQSMEAISEQSAVFNDEMDEEKVKETEDSDTNNQDDPWCVIDEQSESKQDQTMDSMDSQQLQRASLTSPSYRFKMNHYKLTSDHRPYHKNWRNAEDKPIHIGYRINKQEVAFKPPKVIKLLVEFVKHVTIPSRENYPINTVLTKTWAMKNVGRHPWGYGVELVYCKGDEILPLYKRYPVCNAQPGEIVEISATIKTPEIPGRYCTYFRLQKYGKFFGPRVWVDVIVGGKTHDNYPLNARQTNLNHSCAKEVGHRFSRGNNQNNKWKRKYTQRHETWNNHHYKVVSCK